MAQSIQTPAVRPRRMSDIKSALLQPALTNNFEVYTLTPEGVKGILPANGILDDPEKLILSCSEASLPGSSIATHEITNDFSGVTERHGYRRLYDDKADFTFYVDRNYYQIRYFEAWMRYIVNEQVSSGGDGGNDIRNKNYTYRVNWPTLSQTTIVITKFEKDYGASYGINNTKLAYHFINAFPTSIASMPVTYESASLLKCTVSFSYSRYFVDKVKATSIQPQQSPPSAPSPGNPDVPTSNNPPVDDNLAIWALSNQKMIQNQNRAPVNIESQNQILANANATYPAGSPQRAQLLQKAQTYNPNVRF